MSVPPLIHRNVFFGNPDRTAVQLSPDGRHLSWLAPVAGVLNGWVARRDEIASARPMPKDTGRGIWIYMWTFHPTRFVCSWLASVTRGPRKEKSF